MKNIFAFLLLMTAMLLYSAEPLWKNLPDGGKNEKIYYISQFSDFKEISDQEMLFFKKYRKKRKKKKFSALYLNWILPEAVWILP